MKAIDPALTEARDAEEAAWEAYVNIRRGGGDEATAKALKAYDDARVFTDDMVARVYGVEQ